MLKVTNIKWDTDGDEEVLQDLPTEMIIPYHLEDWYKTDREYATEEISDWLSEETGFCHSGFKIVKEITAESVEEELYDFFNDQIFAGDAYNIERVRVFKDNLVTVDNGIIIDCVGGKQIRFTIQVE